VATRCRFRRAGASLFLSSRARPGSFRRPGGSEGSRAKAEARV
jgi:hypothetical protein